MWFRFRRLRHTDWVLRKIYPGTALHGSYGAAVNVLTTARSTACWYSGSNRSYRSHELARWQRQRYSTVPVRKREMLSTVDILPFIQSTLYKPTGPFHCWLNTTTGDKNLFKGDGIYLVLVDEYPKHSLEEIQNSVKMFEKAKSLQQRYPSLQVLALQCGKSINLNDIPPQLLQRIIKEYFVFPILLSRKIFEVASVPCHIISKGFQNPVVYSGVDVDLKELDKAIRDLNAEDGKESNVKDLKSPWMRPIGAVKESDICSGSQNLLFPFPGCISVDESGNRVFLSDINHHRIIVFNNNGTILDAIGSSPGFEDGEFEIAKLMRPAASFYDASDDCLYFVDSENHAIRRADMERRVVETVFPVADAGKMKKGLWTWIVDKIWTKRSTKLKSEEFYSESFLFPWHLLKSSNDGLFVLNQSLGTLWVIDLESGQIREVVKESSKILEICGQMILEKCMPLNCLPSDLLERQAHTYCSFEVVPYAGLMSSVASCQEHVIFCNTVGQTVVKFDKRTGSASTLQFSNFGVLGLPYWVGSSSPEHLYAANLSGLDIDHSEGFRLLPGRVEIELNVDIPQDTDLVEPPQEGSIWRQARGAATEVSGVENKAASEEKVGIAQQWYDELDNLTFAMPQEEPSLEEENQTPVEELPEGRVRIGCTINTSPGTSEAVIYAVLYLRLKKKSTSIDTQGKKAARMVEILDPRRKFNKDLLIKTLLMTPDRDLDELIFMRPLHVRLQFNTRDRPKADKSRREVLTDSSVKIHVTL